MMDAADASYNAVRKIFQDAKVLMCFFHVKYNFKKNYSNYGFTNKDWKLIEVDIDYLHASMCQEEFKVKKKLKLSYKNGRTISGKVGSLISIRNGS